MVGLLKSGQQTVHAPSRVGKIVFSYTLHNNCQQKRFGSFSIRWALSLIHLHLMQALSMKCAVYGGPKRKPVCRAIFLS